jgi:hypothetical protein
MKNTKIISVAILTLFVTIACEKSEDATLNTVEGNYVGTITTESTLKNVSTNIKTNFDAKAEVSRINNEQIQVHCFGSEFDTTFMLNYFEYYDSVMVCLTGDDFEHMYGHRYGEGHMSGGMMNDRQNGETEWMHHMSDEHIEGDEHFGGFDMMNQSFGYSFKMADHNYQFQGTRE